MDMEAQENKKNIDITLIVIEGCIGCNIQENIINEFIKDNKNKYNISFEKLNYEDMHKEFKNITFCDFPATIIQYNNKERVAEGTISVFEMMDIVQYLINEL